MKSLKKRKNRDKLRLLLILLLMTVLLPATLAAGQTEPRTIVSIEVDGEITPAMAAFLENKINEAHRNQVDGIIIEMSTLGGRVDSATDMRDAIMGSRIPIVIYIRNRAISAGALISIAAEHIAMAPGSHIGSAKPIPDDPKTVAYVSGEFRTTAETTGRDPQIAAAMVDAAIEIEGLVREGEILDMTALQALEYGYADFIVDSRSEILQVMGWEGAEIIDEEMDFRYRIAQFLTSYEVASLLLSIGMIALIAEFYTQGFGISGIIGIACFVLYFSSGFIAGYTDFWAVAIFTVGIILLIVELTIPGFGVFGISGLAAMFIGIILAAPDVRQGVFSLMIALVVSVLAIPIFIKVFGKSRLVQRFVLATAETVDMGYVHTAASRSYLVGKNGIALTVLRPSGKVQIDEERLDAIAEGEYIDKGQKVRVARVEGSKVIVYSQDD